MLLFAYLSFLFFCNRKNCTHLLCHMHPNLQGDLTNQSVESRLLFFAVGHCTLLGKIRHKDRIS